MADIANVSVSYPLSGYFKGSLSAACLLTVVGFVLKWF